MFNNLFNFRKLFPYTVEVPKNSDDWMCNYHENNNIVNRSAVIEGVSAKRVLSDDLGEIKIVAKRPES